MSLTITKEINLKDFEFNNEDAQKFANSLTDEQYKIIEDKLNLLSVIGEELYTEDEINDLFTNKKDKLIKMIKSGKNEFN